jgi:hypothetical protein
MQLSFFDRAMKYQGSKKSIKFLNEMKENGGTFFPLKILIKIHRAFK